MKYTIILIGLVSFYLLFASCSNRYVSDQPSAVISPRPPSPSNRHVWRGDDWVWNNRSHTYIRRNGYWDVPPRGRAYREGHWHTNRHGNRWVPGRWK